MIQVCPDQPDLTKRKREDLTISETPSPKETEEIVQPSKKKKKEFVGKSNFVDEDAFEDILEKGWFYLDSSDNPQGPFTSKEMKEWFIAGFFFETTMVKRINDTDYLPISDCKEFKQLELSSSVVSTDIYYNYQTGPTTHKMMESSLPVGPYFDPSPYAYEEEPDKGTYSQTAFFNTQTGKFTPTSSYYASRGIPEDRAGRMLAHYLDVDDYQERMRASKANPDMIVRPKVTKKMISAYKKKKKDKQTRRILMM